jgi:hypothetical protein
LAQELDQRKVQSQELEMNLTIRFVFAGEPVFIKPHGAERERS